MAKAQSRLPAVLKKHESDLLTEWGRDLAAANESGNGRISETELQSQTRDFLRLALEATQRGNSDIESPEWKPMREFLDGVSRSRVNQGFTSDQTATFIFSFKKPLFARLQQELGNDAASLAQESWSATELLDKLGMYTVR